MRKGLVTGRFNSQKPAEPFPALPYLIDQESISRHSKFPYDLPTCSVRGLGLEYF